MLRPAEIALSAEAAVAAIARGEITAESYASALLRQCRDGAHLNAFITLEADRVLEEARERDLQRSGRASLGPLHGLPIPVKDSINTSQLPTTGGTPALRNFQPEQDAPVVRTLRAAGAIVLGKTNLHELSLGYSSNNHAFGPVRNPYDAGRTPGGSSGGTSAAVAFGMAPLGLAEDTEGSIRVPAALCGIAGFRPSIGRYSTAGCIPISSVFDQVGPHARCVADLILFDRVLTHNAHPRVISSLRGLRLGVIRSYFFSGVDFEVEKICTDVLDRLCDAGIQLVEQDMPQLADLVFACTRPVQNHDLKPALAEYLWKYQTGVTFESLVSQSSANVRRQIEAAATPGGRDFVPEEHYREIVSVQLPRLRRMYFDYFSRTGVAAIIFPATRVPAPLIGDDDMEVDIRGNRMPFDHAISRNVAPGSTAGLPGLVLPVGITAGGLPVAIELDGPSRSDATLLELGAALEQVIGFSPRIA